MELLLLIECTPIGEVYLVELPLQDALVPLTALIHSLKDVIRCLFSPLAMEDILLEASRVGAAA